MIRRAEERDLQQLKEIYNEAVVNTTATFDKEIKDDEDRMAWLMEHSKEPYVLFVEETDGIIQGYASLSSYNKRKAFEHTVEISVYIGKEYRGQGIGKALMEYTLAFAKEHPQIHTVISLITGENEKSIHLHEKLGFQFCGQLHQVGNKFDRWLDLNFYEIVFEDKLMKE